MPRPSPVRTIEDQEAALRAIDEAHQEMPISLHDLCRELGLHYVTVAGWRRGKAIQNPRLVIRAIRDLRSTGRLVQETPATARARAAFATAHERRMDLYRRIGDGTASPGWYYPTTPPGRA